MCLRCHATTNMCALRDWQLVKKPWLDSYLESNHFSNEYVIYLSNMRKSDCYEVSSYQTSFLLPSRPWTYNRRIWLCSTSKRTDSAVIHPGHNSQVNTLSSETAVVKSTIRRRILSSTCPDLTMRWIEPPSWSTETRVYRARHQSIIVLMAGKAFSKSMCVLNLNSKVSVAQYSITSFRKQSSIPRP